jgi:hypothetical protein
MQFISSLLTLHESKISGKNVSAALLKIVSYIERKLETKLIRIPGVEHFHNSDGSGYGHRYVFDGSVKCIRFNWDSASTANTATMTSIDIFNGKRDPSFSVHTKGISLVKALPMLVTILKSPSLGKRYCFPIEEKDALAESVLYEAKRDDFTAEAALADFLQKLASGKTYTRSDFIGQYHIVHAGIFDTVFKDFREHFKIEQKRVSLEASSQAQLTELKKSILDKAGVVEVTSGGSDETYDATEGEEALEDAEERVSFIDSLDHLEGLVTGIIKGAFNALFVAGKGGVGKTQTVERVLSAHGLSDGSGYFKNTGSASAVGIYTLLYQHRKDIILFDDCDGALADQDARNLIKSATDTKKKRKMVWNKKSSFIFNPDEDDLEQYEGDPDMAPKWFDFEGRIIFISNLPLKKLDPDGALRTRAFIINIDPTTEELFDYMQKILYDVRLEDGLSLTNKQRDEVMEVVKSSKRKGDVSIRKLVRALNLAASGAGNWKQLVSLYA